MKIDRNWFSDAKLSLTKAITKENLISLSPISICYPTFYFSIPSPIIPTANGLYTRYRNHRSLSHVVTRCLKLQVSIVRSSLHISTKDRGLRITQHTSLKSRLTRYLFLTIDEMQVAKTQVVETQVATTQVAKTQVAETQVSTRRYLRPIYLKRHPVNAGPLNASPLPLPQPPLQTQSPRMQPCPLNAGPQTGPSKTQHLPPPNGHPFSTTGS